jgi:hypothetical protein
MPGLKADAADSIDTVPRTSTTLKETRNPPSPGKTRPGARFPSFLPPETTVPAATMTEESAKRRQEPAAANARGKIKVQKREPR